MTARHRVENFEVAIKFIIKDKVPEHAWWDDEVLGRVPTEVMVMSLIGHDNIVRCLDLFEDDLYFYLVRSICFEIDFAVVSARADYFLGARITRYPVDFKEEEESQTNHGSWKTRCPVQLGIVHAFVDSFAIYRFECVSAPDTTSDPCG